MAAWSQFETDAPQLAAAVRARFTAHLHAIIATLNHSGAPRVSGIETSFWNGGLWLGMMPGSRKALDLQRDPRFALHSAPLDVELIEGDATLRGRAQHVTDGATIEAFATWRSQSITPKDIALFRADVAAATLVHIVEQTLVVEAWREGSGLSIYRRR